MRSFANRFYWLNKCVIFRIVKMVFIMIIVGIIVIVIVSAIVAVLIIDFDVGAAVAVF